MASTWPGDFGEEVARSNAKLIVKAVNLYDELIQTLEDVHAHLCGWREQTQKPSVEGMLAELEAALKKARES